MYKDNGYTKHHNMCLNSRSLYDEVSHTIDSNILYVKLPKSDHVKDESITKPTPIINCLDKYDKKCKKTCPKVKVIHNQAPGPKKPEEEMLLLKTTRQITPNDDMKYSLEVEFKAPRNYTPLPPPGPPPPIIKPKQPIITKEGAPEDKNKKKKQKKKKKK